MHKKTLFIFVLTFLILTLSQLGTADYYVFNGSDTTDVWVAYSTWRDHDDKWSAGYRTIGWYKVAPGSLRTLWVPSGNQWVYVRIERNGAEIRPSANRDSHRFWMHPTKAFTTVLGDDGFRQASYANTEDQDSAVKERFYKYPNGNRFVTSGPHKLGVSTQTHTFTGEKGFFTFFQNPPHTFNGGTWNPGNQWHDFKVGFDVIEG